MTPVRLLPCIALLLSSASTTLAQEPSRSSNPLASLDKALLKGFVEQPLFEPSRQPPVVTPPNAYVAPPMPAVVEPPPPLRLLGLIEGADFLAAVVRRNDTGRTETLHPGDHIGSWVVHIMPATLRMVNGDRSYDYALFQVVSGKS